MTTSAAPTRGNIPTLAQLIDVFVNIKWTLVEARPVVLVVFALRFMAGGLIGSSQPFSSVAQVVVGQISWFAAVWFVYLLNGISDIQGDRANRSTRPLASGKFSSRFAMVTCIVLAALSLSLAAVSDMKLVGGVAAMLVLGTAYSLGRFATKRWAISSSVTVGIAGFLTYVCGAVVYRDAISLDVVITASLLAAWMATAGNLKDFGDETGDRAAGRRSLPIAIGPTGASWVIGTLCGSIGVISLVVTVHRPELWPIAFLLLASIAIDFFFVVKDLGKARPDKLAYRIFMVSQYTVNGCLLVYWGVALLAHL